MTEESLKTNLISHSNIRLCVIFGLYLGRTAFATCFVLPRCLSVWRIRGFTFKILRPTELPSHESTKNVLNSKER